MRENIKMGKEKEMENLHILMDVFLMDNGKMEARFNKMKDLKNKIIAVV